MSIELITLMMFGALALLLMSGIPIGFATGGLAALFTILLWGPSSLFVIATRAFNRTPPRPCPRKSGRMSLS